MDFLAVRNYIRNFSLDDGPLGNQGYSRVLLQLFGSTGHGKSSFINSCKCVVDDGAYQVYATVAESEKKPETMIRKAYELTDNITLVDNRGCVKMNKNELGEIYAQLGNFLPLNAEVEWQSEFKDMLDIILKAETQDQPMAFIVPVLVYSASKMLPLAEMKDVEDIIEKAKNITGLVPIVVITNERSEHLLDIQEKFRRMGVRKTFPIENYTEKDHLKTRETHEGILKCLHEIIKDVEFRMRERRDPVTEKIQRKRILYEFAHKRGLEKEREDREKEERENKKPQEGFGRKVLIVALAVVTAPVRLLMLPINWLKSRQQ